MKKSKFQVIQRISTIFAIGILMLQVLVPVGVVFADNIDTNSVETFETSDTSAVGTQTEEAPAGTGTSKAPEQPVTPAEEGTGETKEAPAATEADDAQEEPEGDEDEDPDPETDAESTSDAEQKSSEEEKVSDEKKEEEKDDSGADESDAQLFNVGPQRELGDIFSLDYMRINGEDIEDGDFITIVEGTKADFRFKWDTENLDPPAKVGDTAALRLSDAFKQVNITTPQDIIVDGITVGTYTVENGVILFLFDEDIEQGNVQNGYVEFELEFNLDAFRENRRQEIPFEHNDGRNITIEARPNLDHSGIKKEGKPDSEHDAREITWSVDVLNTDDDAITDATLNDTPPSGLGEARDFVIRKLTVDFDGNVIPGEVLQILADSFPIDLGTIEAYEGYRVEYKTTIQNYAEQSFTNNAEFDYNEIDEPLPAEDTVGGLTRSNPIEKNGVLSSDTPGSERIRWTIDVNKNGQPINEAIVYDDWPDGLHIVPESIEVFKIIQDGDYWTRGEDHSGTFTEFPINLGQLTEDDTYRIEFETTVDWSEVNDGEYQEKNGFNNKATLFDGETEFNDDDATVEFDREAMLEKVGANNVDYDNKTITWTVTLNKAKQPLGDVTVTDYLPKGVKLDLNATPTRYKITGDGGKDFSGVTPSLTEVTTGEHAGKEELKFVLPNVGTETVTIEYTTDIKDFTAASFTNVVGIDGVGVGEWGDPRDAIINPTGNSYGKGYRGIHYGNKTIDWRLTVDPRREAIQSLTIEDSFPNKGLIALPDSFTVTFAGEPLEKGSDYTLSPRTEGGETGYHKGFVITINDDLLPLDGGQLIVDYKTSYDRQREVDGNTLDPHEPNEGVDNSTDRLYINRVQYTGNTVNGNPIDQSRDASQRVREDSWNSGKKEGKLISIDGAGTQVNGWVSGNERKVAWDFYFNYLNHDLGTGVVIRDNLQYEGEIDLDSVVISVYDVAQGGGTNITETVLDPSNYTPRIDNGELVIEFGDFVVDERYVVSFTTSVPNKSAQTYTNHASVKTQDRDTPWDYSGTVRYDEYDEFLSKSAVVQGNQVYTGDEVNWQARVNDSLSIIENPVVTDTISAGHIYINDSLEVFRVEGTNEVPLVENTDYTLNVNPLDEGKTALVVNLNDRLEQSLILRYKTVVTETEGEIGNEISLKGEDVVYEEISSGNLKADEFSRVGGEWSRSTRGAIRLIKEDAEEETVIANNEATFTLWYDLNGELVQFGEYTTTNGLLEIGNLPLRTYYLREETAPEGYVPAEDDLEIVVDTANSPNNVYFERTFENTKEKIDIKGTKEWVGGETVRPDSVQLQLFNGETPIGDPVTVNATSDWSHTWTDLDRTNIDGVPHEYHVDEVNVPDNFEKSISDDGLTVINTFESPKTIIPVEKIWNDAENQDGIRPDDIEVELLANGNETDVDNLVLNDGNDWQDSFTELPALDNTGAKITYTLEEVDVPDGYASQITGNAETGFTVTNSHTPSKTEIPVFKDWEDNTNQDGIRPDKITVRLYADGSEEETANAIVTAAGGWTHTFTNLDEYKDGEKIVYTVVEDEVPGYTSSLSENDQGLVITNAHEPELIDLEGTKIWNDADDQDGARPDSITVHLKANGAIVATQEVTPDEDGNWHYVFEEKPQYQNGVAILYTVQEDPIEGYTPTYSVDGLSITNRHTPDTTYVEVTKSWNDEQNQDGIRPESVTVRLLADGEATNQTRVLRATNNWNATFANLAKNKNGEPIEYTVEEVMPENSPYESTITGSQDEGYTIDNSYTPETIDISGVKTWNDNNDQDGTRPDSIIVYLKADGAIIETQEVTPAADGNWSYTFEGQPKFKDGTLIQYTVQEEKIEGYTPEYSTNGLNITNSHTPDKTFVEVGKIWSDNKDQDGIRPEFVAVELFANGATTNQRLVLNEGNNWHGIFDDLDKNQEGQEIVYTVQEVVAEDGTTSKYRPVVSGSQEAGYIIDNQYTPEKTSISGTKIWDDDNDRDGQRPESITVYLLKDNQRVRDTEGKFIRQEVKANGTNEWAFSFDNLPKRENGQIINYSVEEVKVEGYQSNDPEFDGTEAEITNSYTPGLTSVGVRKVWEDAQNQDGIRPESITIHLLADGEVIDEQELNEDNKWRYTFTDLDEYRIGEVGQLVEYTVEEVVPDGYEKSIEPTDPDEISSNNFVVTNSHTPEITEVSITKEWEDEGNLAGFRPDHIEVELYADGEATGNTVDIAPDENGVWEGSFINLPKYRDGGIQIDYTVAEVSLDEDLYSVDSTPSEEDSDAYVYDYTLTNTHEVERVEVNVTKEWQDEDNLAGFRPDHIEVELYEDGEATGKIINIVGNEEDEWEGSFINLPKYQNGEIVDYTIKEVSLDEELYSVETIAGETDSDGNVYDYTLVNTHEVERVEVNVTKEWEDDENISGFRPEHIEVELYENGEATGKVIAMVADENGAWEASFINLPKYRNGEVIDYTIAEVSLDEDIYSLDITPSGEDSDENVYDYTLTNTHDVEYIDVVGSKTWDDANNQDGNRPDEITVNLLANGSEIDEQVVTAEDDWSYVFENLPKFINGEEATYTVTEDEVEDYSTEIDGFDITNSYTPEERSITVTKAWDDANNQDGLQPDAIEVQLYANGEESGEPVSLSDDNDWTYTWTELAVNEAGEQIDYTVDELNVHEDYTVAIDDENLGNVIITNSHTPEQIDITGTKTWRDNNDQDGKRPESITVELLKDGKVTDSVEVTEADDWTYSFTDLDKFRDQGIEIDYTIREVAVEDDDYQPGYEINENVVNITNTYTPGKTSVDVLKVWQDEDDHDGIRPDSIKVRLLADGEVVKEQKVTAKKGWRYIFTDLDKYKAGEEKQLIHYTVEEVPVDGYQTSMRGSARVGYVITNSHTPKEAEKKPSKPKKRPKKQKHGKLPQTGEVQSWILPTAGILIIGGVAATKAKRKKKE